MKRTDLVLNRIYIITNDNYIPNGSKARYLGNLSYGSKKVFLFQIMSGEYVFNNFCVPEDVLSKIIKE